MLAEKDDVGLYKSVALRVEAAWDLVVLDCSAHAIGWVGFFAFDASLSTLC